MRALSTVTGSLPCEALIRLINVMLFISAFINICSLLRAVLVLFYAILLIIILLHGNCLRHGS